MSEYVPIEGQPGRSICALKLTDADAGEWRRWRWRCECGSSGGPWGQMETCLSQSAAHRCDFVADWKSAFDRIRASLKAHHGIDLGLDTPDGLAAVVDTAIECGASDHQRASWCQSRMLDIARAAGVDENEACYINDPGVKRLIAKIESAAADEREACAKLVEDTDVEVHRGSFQEDDGRGTLRAAAAAIRARGAS